MSSSSPHSLDYTAFAELLRSVREEAGVTQIELANRLGTEQSTISKIERRERRVDVTELRQICMALGISFVEFASRFERSISSSPVSPFDGFPDRDADWSMDQWNVLLEHLVAMGLVTRHEITALVLGHLNPSQVGTSIASKKSFQKNYSKRKTWQAVRQWHFNQPGTCSDCGTRLELQADHIISKEIVGKIGGEIAEKSIDDRSALMARIDEELMREIENCNIIVSEILRRAVGEALCDAILAGESDHMATADRVDNIVLRCRRCNVIRRPSHKHGGEAFLTTEAALMWILLVKRPDTYEAFEKICRSYGMTMANIRFEEAWAMAIWLARDGTYSIDPSSKYK